MSKGSRPRPLAVARDEYARRHARTFGQCDYCERAEDLVRAGDRLTPLVRAYREALAAIAKHGECQAVYPNGVRCLCPKHVALRALDVRGTEG